MNRRLFLVLGLVAVTLFAGCGSPGPGAEGTETDGEIADTETPMGEDTPMGEETTEEELTEEETTIGEETTEDGMLTTTTDAGA